MRKSFDSLSCLAREVIGEDPLSGYLFVFLNRKRDAAKLLYWEQSGFWIYYKRLEKGNFKLPVSSKAARSVEIESRELSLLLEGITLDGAKYRAKFIRESLPI